MSRRRYRRLQRSGTLFAGVAVETSEMVTMLRGNHYQVLTIKPGASADEVESAYRLCTVLSRDEGADAADLLAARARIDEAYAVLSDPARRAEYDRENGFPPAPPPRLAAPPATGPAIPVRMPQPVFHLKTVADPPPPPTPAPVATRPPGRPPMVAHSGPLGGAELRRYREQHGVTLEHIASVTKVSVRTLQDIENERFDRLPAPVYVRSFVQQYAREVGLEPRAAAEAYLTRVKR